jgi:hypothetical protein
MSISWDAKLSILLKNMEFRAVKYWIFVDSAIYTYCLPDGAETFAQIIF